MKNLALKNPDRHRVGPYFEECLTEFSDAVQMSRETKISDSSINHILNGRPIIRNRTRERYEAQCRVYLDSRTKPPTPHIETPPAQQVLDLDPQTIFLVSVPTAKVNRLQKVLAMFDIEMVEID